MNGSDAKSMVSMAEAVKVILEGIGEDIDREGLVDTPARVAKAFLEMTAGLREMPPKITTFEKGSNEGMVTVLDIDYWSLCEHHLLPFNGRAHVGYIPGEKLAGLSKIARVVDYFAKRPQIQEQMTAQIADYLVACLSPVGTIVVVEGSHLCMSCRGAKKANSTTVTSAIRGDAPKVEFFDILKIHRGQ